MASVEIGPARRLIVSFRPDAGYGTLAIESDQPDFELKLARAGKMYRSAHVAGKTIIFDHLPPGQYVVSASKDGFGAAAGVPVAVRRLQKARVVVSLESLSSFLVHSLPQTEILVDGKSVGITDANGNLTLNNVACARHMVEARRHDHKLAKEVQLIGDKLPDQVDLPLKPESGTVVLTLFPASSTVSVSQVDGKVLPLSGTQFELPGGQYRITVKAPNFEERTQTVDIVPERINHYDLSLTEQRPAFQPTQTLTANIEGWNRQEWDFNKKSSAMSHKKAGISLFDSQHSQGSYVFTVSRDKFPMLGRRTMQWVANYLDPNNYLLFSISRAGFESYFVQNGQATQHGTTSQTPELDQYTIAMIVQARQIDVFLQEDGKWVRIGQWTNVQQDLDRGKFGFKDRVIVRNFRFDGTHPLLTAGVPH